MARSRTLRPSFFTSFSLAQVSRDARLFYAGLWVEADDEGRLIDSPKMLAGSIFPHDEDVTPKKVDGWIRSLIGIGAVERYEADGGKYIHIKSFVEHQKPPHPTPSRLPPPSSLAFHENGVSDSGNSTGNAALGFGLGSCLGLGSLSSGDFAKADDDDPQAAEVEAALRILAERDLARREADIGKVGIRESWLVAATERRRADHAEAIADALGQFSWKADALVDHLEAPEAKSLHPQADRRRIDCAACEGAGMVETDLGCVRCPSCSAVAA